MAEGQIISWTVKSHAHKEHSVDWYWSVGVIAFVAAAISVWLGNVLFAVIIVVAVGSLAVLLLRGPREHTVRVDQRGVSVDGTLYPYKSINSFWVERQEHALPIGHPPRLYLLTSAVVAPHIMLPLDNHAHAEQVRYYLKRVVPEVEQEAHFGEHLAELIGL